MTPKELHQWFSTDGGLRSGPGKPSIYDMYSEDEIIAAIRSTGDARKAADKLKVHFSTIYRVLKRNKKIRDAVNA